MINVDQILYGLLAAIVSAAGVAAIKLLPLGESYLKQKAESIKDDATRAAVDQALDILTNVTQTVVTSLEQTTVDALKAEANGQLTAENAKLVKDKAITQIKSIISVDALALLQGKFGDLDSYIGHLIEGTVFQIKPAVVEKPVAPAAK